MPSTGTSRTRTAVAAIAALFAMSGAVLADFEETRIADARFGTPHSDMIRDFSDDGFELSDGTPIVFGDWYDSTWRDLRLTFVTPLSPDFGLFWGFGTGESGGQYEIDPSLTLGFVSITPLSEQSRIALRTTFVVGGYLTEKPCTADYGDIGGVQTVNCRLAASPMPPAETLDYLIHRRPSDQVRISLAYELEF